MAKAKPPETITITYDLFDLPTAQHKAGLAGLLLQINSMANRKLLAPTYCWDENASNTKVSITLTSKSVQSLFDDVYAAEVIEEAFPQKKKKEQLKSERIRETPKGKVKEFIYDWTRPILPTLRHYLLLRGRSVCCTVARALEGYALGHPSRREHYSDTL